MNLNELLSAHVWIALVVWKPLINVMDREYQKVNFLKQEVKNHVKFVALTVVDLIKEVVVVVVYLLTNMTANYTDTEN